MKFEMNIEKKWAFAVLLVFLLLVGVLGVYGYNSNPANPSNFGHSIYEVDGINCNTGQALTKTSYGWSCLDVNEAAKDFFAESNKFNFETGSGGISKYYYASLPVNPSSTTLDGIFPNAPTGLKIYIYRGGSFSSYTKGFTGWSNPSPPLAPGEGIVVKTVPNSNYTVSVPGSSLTSSASVILGGTSLIGIPYCPGGYVYKASAILAELNSLGKSCTTIQEPAVSTTDVPTYTNAKWYSTDSSFTSASGINIDFYIRRGHSYYITCSSGSFTWTPSCNS